MGISDDEVKTSNLRGRMTFATSGPDTRTTQMFINYKDNTFLDDEGFSPFAEVVEGMHVVDQLYAGYGEGAPQGHGPQQGIVERKGNEYLMSSFPKLSYIETAEIDGLQSTLGPAIASTLALNNLSVIPTATTGKGTPPSPTDGDRVAARTLGTIMVCLAGVCLLLTALCNFGAGPSARVEGRFQ